MPSSRFVDPSAAPAAPAAPAAVLTAIGGNVFMPELPSSISSVPTLSDLTIDADNKAIAVIFRAPETGIITGFGAPTGALTTADAALAFRLEGVTTAVTPAKPSGSLIATGANADVNVNAANTWFNAVFGTPYPVTKGQLLAAIVQRKAGGTFNGNFRTFSDEDNASSGSVIFPFQITNGGASWSMSFSGTSTFAISYGGIYYPIRGLWPFIVITQTSFSNTSTPDVIGNVWIPRVACNVNGIYIWAGMSGGCVVKFYAADGVTVLAAALGTLNARSVTSQGLVFLPFDPALGAENIEPVIGTKYRIGIEPSSSTALLVYDFTVGEAAILNALGFGVDMYKTSAKDPSGVGSWTDVTTKRVFMGVSINKLLA